MITPLPTPPSTADSANFNARANAFLGSLPVFVTEANAVASEVNTNKDTAVTAAATSTTQAELATTNGAVQVALAAGHASNTAADAIATAADRIQTGIDRAVVESISTTAGVASVNGMTGIITDIAYQNTVQTLTNKTIHGNTNTLTADGTNAVGFRHIPQISQSAAYTLVLTDASKHILHPSADTTARIFTIPANSAVAFPIGSAITFVNQASAGVVTIAITTDTMRLAGAGTTGSRTLAANGVATAIKLTATEWIISGNGLT